MRNALFTGFVLASAATALASINVTPARASGAVCGTSPTENQVRCDWATIAQCRATLSGQGGQCHVNPYTSFASAPKQRSGR